MIPKNLLAELNRWIDEKKYGNIQINFSGGKIVNYNRSESVKLEIYSVDPNLKISASISSSGATLASE